MRKKLPVRNNLIPWFLFTMTFGLLLQIVFLNAPLQSDDTTYFSTAENLSIESLRTAPNHTYLRVGLLVPAWLMIKVFGYGITGYYLLSVGFAMMLLATAFFLVNRIAGLRAAVLSCLLYSSSAFGLYQTTNLLPDVPNLLFLLAAFLFFILALDHPGRRGYLFLALAAFLGFYAYLIRMPNSVFLIAIPAYEFLERRSLRKSVLFAAVAGLLWILESLFYLAITGDFWFRFNHLPQGMNPAEIYQATVPWFQPALSLGEYLFAPFGNLLKFNAGLILLPGGLLGLALALKKKNYALLSLFLGSLLLFASYSYSLNSISPLIRTLPLQIRYIVSFTMVLTMATGLLLDVAVDLAGRLFSARAALGLLVLAVIALPAFFLGNYSSELPYRILNNRDSFFVADRILGEYLDQNAFNGVVNTLPRRDFALYPNFSRLKLEHFELSSPPKDNAWFLLSRNWLRERLYYARLKNNQREIRTAELLLQDRNPEWRYILDTDEIVLAFIPGFELEYERVLDFLDGWGEDSCWEWNRDRMRVERSGEALLVTGDLREPQYLYTFPGSFNIPPKGFPALSGILDPDGSYLLQLRYEVREPGNSLLVFWSEYDSRARIKSLVEKLPYAVGEHSFHKFINVSGDCRAFRLFLRLKWPDLKEGSGILLKEAALFRVAGKRPAEMEPQSITETVP